MKAHRPAAPSRWFLHHSWTKAPLVALDFETTGLNMRRDAIISYGAVPIVERRVDLGRAQYREVRPQVPPSSESIAVHHLRPVDLREAPSMRVTRDELRLMLERSYIVTWVAQVEAGFLATVFGGGSLYWLRRTIDTYRMARALVRLEGGDPATVGRLDATAERYGVPVEDAHHALDDAVMTAELFLVLAAKLAARLDDDRLKKLRRAALRS
jgi:DNA polymerase III subunit epsilon